MPPEALIPPVETTRRREVSADGVLAALATASMVWLSLQVLDFGFGRDQGIFAVVGRTLRDGGMPYRDAWDFKPPGIFFIYALAGSTVRGIRLVEVAAWLSLVFAFRRLSALHLQRPLAGTLGGAVAVATHAQLEFWHTAQPESFGVVAIAWAMALTAAATMSPDLARPARLRRFVASGVCYGIASLLKPTMGVAVMGSVAYAAVVEARDRRTGVARMLSGVLGGLLVPVLACAAFFALRGAWPDMRAALVGFAPRYTALAWRNADVLDVTSRLVRQWLFEYSYLIPAGLLCLVAMRSTPASRRGLWHAGLVIILLLAGVLAQGKLFAYHFDAVLPITALVAGWGLSALWDRVHRSAPGVTAFLAIIVVAVMCHDRSPDLRDAFSRRSALRLEAWLVPARAREIRERLYSVADYRAADNARAADWIRAETPRDAAVFLYGFTPELYVASGRRLASRYLYSVPQKASWSQVEARATLIADLRESRPAAILIEHGDALPWVDGSEKDSAADAERFAALQSLISTDYEQEPRVGKFDVYRRTH